MLHLRLLTLFLLLTFLLIGCKRPAKINLPNGASYKGMTSNGKPHGKGKLVSHDLKYEGDFLDGKRHGNLTLGNGRKMNEMAMEFKSGLTAENTQVNGKIIVRTAKAY